MARPPVPPYLTGSATTSLPQSLFPATATISTMCTVAFSPRLSLTCPEAASLQLYKNNVLVQTVIGGTLTAILPAGPSDARTRIHWQVNMLDMDGNVAGSHFAKTDCNFDAPAAAVTLAPSTTAIITNAQVITITPTITPSNPILLATPRGTFASNTVDGTVIAGAVLASGTPINLTLNYTNADNGNQSLAVTVTDAGGNIQVISIPITVNIA